MNSSLKRYAALLTSSALLCCSGSFINSFIVVNASPKASEVPYSHPIAQSNKRTLIRHLTILKYPVELSFKLKGQPLKSTETVLLEQAIRTNEFDAGAGWLKDFTISVKNISTKTITYVQVNLFFPEVRWHGRQAAHHIDRGVDPDRKFPRPELRLAPNESLEIPLAAEYTDVKLLMSDREEGPPIEDVSRLEVEFHSALFDDETLFQTGEMFRRNPDPNDPHKWIRIKEE